MTQPTTNQQAHTVCNITEIEPTVDRRWDEFVKLNPRATFYHTTALKQVLQQTYGYRSLYLAAETSESTLCGIFPLFLIQSPFIGKRIVSLPFSDTCGPLVNDSPTVDSLLARAIDLRDAFQAKSVQIRTDVDVLPAAHANFAADSRYVDFVLPLTRDPDEIWSRPSMAGVRGHVRKATKSGVAFVVGESEQDLREFYTLHLKTTKGHGMPAQPYTYFRNLWQNLGSTCDLRLLIARYEGRALAASLFVGFGQFVHYMYNASDSGALHLRPNYLLLWEAIKWACHAGYRQLNMGKTSRYNEGLVNFKRGWGAEAMPLFYLYYPSMYGPTSTSFAENSRKYQLATTVWRALPDSITDLVGGVLYRHLA